MFVDHGAAWAGGGREPRAWQRAALPSALLSIESAEAGLVRAIMGAGKSVLIAEILACCEPGEDEVIILTTPTVALVEQLAATVEERCGVMRVGRYYTHDKMIRKVTVACNPSLLGLLADLRSSGLRVALWVLDEAHNSESPTLLEAAEHLAGVPRLGLTATPYRASKKERLSLFDRLVYSYGAAEALRDGVVVPWELRQWDGAEGADVDDACVAMLRQALNEGVAPLIVDAGGYSAELEGTMPGCADAEAFAARLCAEGMRASFVHSGLRREEVAARLEQLRAGELQVLVHVAMLKEGVDLPWLRGLCLRRRVASATWFAQHVGRALRACPGKTRALIMDPHDLFGMHSLNAEEVLGGGVTDRSPIQQVLQGLLVEIDAAVLDGRRRGSVGDLRLPGHGVARAMPALERVLRRVRVALETVGVVAPPKVPEGGWRRRPASAKQADLVRSKAGGLKRAVGTPREVRVLLRVLFANLEHMSCGAASDFLDLVFQLPRAGGWPPEASALLEVGA